MLRLAATRHANDSPSAIAAIDDFVERMNLAEELGDNQPRVIHTTLRQIHQYGWAATCHECGNVSCVTRVQPRNPEFLIPPQCYNKKKTQIW